MQWGQTWMVIVFLLIMFGSILLIYIYVNMNNYQSRIGVITNAYLFGKDPQIMFERYVKNSQAESIATAMNNIESNTSELNTTNYRLNDKANRLAKQSMVDVPNTYAKSNDLGISIQKNVAQIQDTVSKLGGAFMLNNYMVNGAVKTTQSPTSVPM